MQHILLACFLVLISANSVYAVNTNILSYPPTIGTDKFDVTVQIDGATAGTNYLRIDLFIEGTQNYFGETDNTQSWYNGSDGKQYFPVTIQSGVPTIATVSGQIGSPTLTEYPGPGDYKLRVRRYTASGGTGSDTQTPVSVSLTKTWPSPSPSPSPSFSPIPIPSPSPSPIPIPSPSPSVTPKPKPSLDPSPQVGTVAGTTTAIDLSGFGVSPSPYLQLDKLDEPSPHAPTLNKARAKTAIIIGSGLILISVSGFFGYREYQKRHIITK